jgi:hyperosmotically inducible protein
MNHQKLVPIAAALSLLLGTAPLAHAADSTDDKPASSSSVGTAISDTTITAKVKATLMDDSRLKQSDISVNTVNGVVTLSGSAPTSEGKSAAEDIAKHVDGVKDVDDQITTPSLGSQISKDAKKAVKKTEQVSSDSWITTKVKSALLADSLTKGFKISVSTTHHIVSLSGKVDTQEAADKAMLIARQVKGVEDVDISALKVGNS